MAVQMFALFQFLLGRRSAHDLFIEELRERERAFAWIAGYRAAQESFLGKGITESLTDHEKDEARNALAYGITMAQRFVD